MWALIRGWALIRINTVFEGFNFFFDGVTVSENQYKL